MSRHDLTSFDPAYETVVGWDPPLETFFAQVLDTAGDEEDGTYEVLWIGTRFREVPDPAAVIAAIAPFASVPADLLGQLAHDRRDDKQQPCMNAAGARSGSRPASAGQAWPARRRTTNPSGDTGMSNAGEELDQFATELERHALKLPRPLAAMVLAVAAARIAGDAPEAERGRVLAHHKCGWDGTMAGYGRGIGAAVNPANSTNRRGGDNG